MVKIIIVFLCIQAFFINMTFSTPVVVNGGEVTVSGAVTSTQIDFMLNYTSNVQWILMIWGPDQVNTDATLFSIDALNSANPVKIRDCYLDQNSYIQYDDVNSIQPSITSFPGDISNGIKAAFNRDLSTGDNKDLRLYPNSVVQVCFISSTVAFVGRGNQKGHQKVCSFLSLHQATNSYFQDRLLGNFAATTLIGSGNLTVYATQSTDGWNVQSWLFLAVVFKLQGLSSFIPLWIGVTYLDSQEEADVAVVSYQTMNNLLQVQAQDMFMTNSANARTDGSYVVRQGASDVYLNYGAYSASGYLVSLYKRKFQTGDVNRDTDVVSGDNTFCFILGNNVAFTTFTQTQRKCLDLKLTTSYSSNFRVQSNNNSNGVINYTKPQNNVVVLKKGQSNTFLYLLGTILALFFIV